MSDPVDIVLPLDNFAVLDPARAMKMFANEFGNSAYDKWALLNDPRRRALMITDLDDVEADITTFNKFDELDPALFAARVNTSFAESV